MATCSASTRCNNPDICIINSWPATCGRDAGATYLCETCYGRWTQSQPGTATGNHDWGLWYTD
jgi:hypothetical protein